MNWKMYTNVSIALCVGAMSAWTAFGQEAPSQEDKDFALELKFILGLQQELRMPDLADFALEQARGKFTAPAYKVQLEAPRIQGLVMQGKFEDAQKMIDALPDAKSFNVWKLRLIIADGYNAFFRFDDQVKLYKEFMKAFPSQPEAHAQDYIDVLYRFSQYVQRPNMIEKYGMDGVEAYRLLLKCKLPDAFLLRVLRGEMVALMIRLAQDMPAGDARKKLLAEADKINDEQFWEQDTEFGKAVVSKAHIMNLQGNPSGAQSMVETYMGQLKMIHDNIIEQAKQEHNPAILAASPMPQCRYLLATMLWAEAQKIAGTASTADDEEKIKSLLLGPRADKGRQGNGAFNHFINVALLYPESQWAANAGDEAEKVQAFIKERYNTELQVPISDEQRRRIIAMQFAAAAEAFANNDFESARDLYQQVLGRNKESDQWITALANLVQCYAELAGETAQEREEAGIFIDTAVSHLAERFCESAWSAVAGDAVRSLAEKVSEIGFVNKRGAIYDIFFKYYPNHPATPALLYQFAVQAGNNDDPVTALKYYGKLESYTNFNLHAQVLLNTAIIYRNQGAVEKENEYLEHAEKAMAAQSPETRNEDLYTGLLIMRGAAIRAQAIPLVRSTNVQEKVDGTRRLVQSATVFANASKAAAEASKRMPDDAKLKELNESAAYHRAATLGYLNYPEDRIPTYRKMAIDAYEDFVKKFPKSDFAPKALIQVGTMYTALNDTGAAQKAFDRLASDYPESDEAANAIPLLAQSLMELGFTNEAVAQYRRMFQNRGQFTPAQYLSAGEALLKARDHTLALEAFDIALQMSGATVHQKAGALIGRAQALYGLKRFEDTQKALAEFIGKYPANPHVLDAYFLQVEVYGTLGESATDNTKRVTYFNDGVKTLDQLARYLNTAEGKVQTDLAAGHLLVRRMHAEKKAGLDNQAKETCGRAAQIFTDIMEAPAGNEKMIPFIHDAYRAGIPLLLEFGAPDLALENCDTYLATFPEGRYTPQIRLWRNQAQAELAIQ